MRFSKLAAAVLTAALAAGCTSRPPDEIRAVNAADTLEAEPGWQPRVRNKKWSYIIVHHGGRHNGSAKIYDKYHRGKGWRGLGYHFVIGNGTGSKDGQVEVGFRWPGQERGAHVGGDNNIGKIGICLVGNCDARKPSAAQMRSLYKLLKFLQTRFQVPASRVKGHYEVVRPGYTHCPGRKFSMNALRARLPVTPPQYDPAAVAVRR